MQDRKEINLTYFEGINSYIKEMPVIVRIDDINKCISIMSTSVRNKPVVKIKFEQLIDCFGTSEEMVTEKNKSVVGRAIVGGILTGGIGAIVGGMSGIGSKKKVKKTYYFVINYRSQDSNEIKAVSFRVNWIGIMSEFRNTLKSRITQNVGSNNVVETYL